MKLFQIASLPVSFLESMVQTLYVRACDLEASCNVVFKGDDEFFLAASFVVYFPVFKYGNLEYSASDEVLSPVVSEDNCVLDGCCELMDNTKLVDCS